MNPRKKVDLKLIIVGAIGVGKTSLLHQYVHKTFYEEYQTTLGASILSKIIILGDTTLKLQTLGRFSINGSGGGPGGDGGDVMVAMVVMAMMIIREPRLFLSLIQVPQEVAQGWCREKDIPYFEVSAKNDINVVQAFEMLASRALSRYQSILENHLTESIKLSPDQSTSRCC
uniref:RAB7B, member RAS oncogene family n=1 Tax=Nomascus leucogenys TaxID=61853 RepID=A0A2I3GTG2_NOMLE